MTNNEHLMKETLGRHAYHLVSVVRAEPLPSWLPENEWSRYTLEHDETVLVGYQIGTLPSVTEYATAVAADLNSRAIGYTHKMPNTSQWKKRTA